MRLGTEFAYKGARALIVEEAYCMEMQQKILLLLKKVFESIDDDQNKVQQMEEAVADAVFDEDDADTVFVKVDACGWLLHCGYSMDEIKRVNTGQEYNSWFFREYVIFFKKREEAKKMGYHPKHEEIYPNYCHVIEENRKMTDFIEMHTNSEDFKKRRNEMAWMNRQISYGNATYDFFVPETYRQISEVAESLSICIAARWKEYLANKLHYVFIKKRDDSNIFAVIIFDEKANLLWAIGEKHKNIAGDDLAAANIFLSQTQHRLKEMCQK